MLTPLVLLLPAALQAGRAHAEAPTPARVDAAIDRGATHLLESSELRPATGGRPGQLALLGHALLASGVDPGDDRIRRLVTELAFASIERTYDVGCTLLFLSEQDERGHRAWIEELAGRLIEWQHGGRWGYPRGAGDLSNTQYAALGLWAATRAGVDVPAATWSELVAAVIQHQGEGGGFAYGPRPPSARDGTGSMTAAGVGTLAICELELARVGRGGAPSAPLAPADAPADQADAFARAARAARERGLDWLAERFRADGNPGAHGWVHYWLYGVERMGAFTGRDHLGAHDWYVEGARWLLRVQAEDGSWGGSTQTCFALLFLSRSSRRYFESRTFGGVPTVAGAAGLGVPRRSEGPSPVGLEVTPLGERVALRLLGFTRAAVHGLEWPGERGRGPRILRVDYVATGAGPVEGRVLGSALGDGRTPSRGQGFAALARVPAGCTGVRARVRILESPATRLSLRGPDTESVVELVSAVVPLAGRGSALVRSDAARERDLLRPGDDSVRVRASSACAGFEDVPRARFDTAQAIDGHPRRPWVPAEGDDVPTLRIETNAPLLADGVRITAPSLPGWPPDELARPLEVELAVDGEVVGRLSMPPDASSEASIDFGARRAVTSLELRVLSSVAGRRGTAAGLGEVRLVARADG